MTLSASYPSPPSAVSGARASGPAVPGPVPTPMALPPAGRAARVRRSRVLKPYNRLAAATVAINLIVAVALGGAVTTEEAFALAGTNVFLATIVRQQYVINLLFWLATRARRTVPLRVRWGLGKVYSFGGIHVGAAFGATGWYLLFVALSVVGGASPSTILTTVMAAVILSAMVVTSLPVLRARHHDVFEIVHRVGGWALLLLVWIQTVSMLVAAGAGPGEILASVPLWLLLLTTVSVALPWLRLRRVPVEIVTPSSHVALVRFDHGVTPFPGSSTAVSRSPLREWHSFANVPAPGEGGFRLTISRSGDWTGRLIDERPTHLWVKGISTAGVGNIDQLFRRVLWVATGSGIGPCLPHLLAQTAPADLLWSTRSPEATYGAELVAEIRAAVPDAMVWDTSVKGKPDLLALAYAAARSTGAEAVICISNAATTWTIVEGLEARGIPAFGAIWDS